jgi:hypothetical protein
MRNCEMAKQLGIKEIVSVVKYQTTDGDVFNHTGLAVDHQIELNLTEWINKQVTYVTSNKEHEFILWVQPFILKHRHTIASILKGENQNV